MGMTGRKLQIMLMTLGSFELYLRTPAFRNIGKEYIYFYYEDFE